MSRSNACIRPNQRRPSALASAVSMLNAKRIVLISAIAIAFWVIHAPTAQAEIVGKITAIYPQSNEIEIDRIKFKLAPDALHNKKTDKASAAEPVQHLEPGQVVSVEEKDALIKNIRVLDYQVDLSNRDGRTE